MGTVKRSKHRTDTFTPQEGRMVVEVLKRGNVAYIGRVVENVMTLYYGKEHLGYKVAHIATIGRYKWKESWKLKWEWAKNTRVVCVGDMSCDGCGYRFHCWTNKDTQENANG